ncbi:MAG: hypothetical protein OEY94_10685 [Alphaproteobacteria bacterium]|nr:hypothetical protein [Alphaproteobacteria bacterium]
MDEKEYSYAEIKKIRNNLTTYFDSLQKEPEDILKKSQSAVLQTHFSSLKMLDDIWGKSGIESLQDICRTIENNPLYPQIKKNPQPENPHVESMEP